MSQTATIAGTVYPVQENQETLADKIDEQSDLSINVIDSSGTASFQKYDSVVLTDSVKGVLFRGIVNQPQLAQQFFPSTSRSWTLACIDPTYRLAKITCDKNYANQYAGVIAADQIQRYGAAENVDGAFALRWDELETEWAAGTLSGTTATTNASDGNAGDGDLELSLAGGNVTILTTTTSDWTNNGTGAGCSGTGNQLVPFNYQGIAYTAENIGNQGSTTYDNYQIWSGSYTIASGDALQFYTWINAGSPQCMASVDALCSDGTYLSLYNSSSLVDQQNGLKLLGSTDLKGYADNQWYYRTFDLTPLASKVIKAFYVVFYGNSQGTYTAYFRDIAINNPAGTPGSALWVFQSSVGTLNTSAQAHTIGYVNSAVTVETVYTALATWVSNNSTSHNNYSAVAIYRTSQASYSASVPSGANLLVEASADGGVTWYTVTNNSPLLGFVAGQAISNTAWLSYRLTMSITGNDPTVQAIVDYAQFVFYPSYAATKNDVSSTVSGSGFSSGTLTNTAVLSISGTQRGVGHAGLFSASALMLNGFWRNWQGSALSPLASQTLYGNSSPAQAVAFNSLQLTGGNGADIRSRQDYAGSSWQNFTASWDVQIPSDSSSSVGGQYRTTNWVNQNNCGAWQIDLGQTSLKLGFGTNSGTVGSYTNVSTVTVSLAASSWHTITLICNGTSHIIQIDGVQYVSVTNSNFNIAGYFGIRANNASGSTKSFYFNNFGIVASTSGTYQSPSIPLNAAGTVGNTIIGVQTEQIPTSCSYTIQTSIDGGTTWSTATPGGTIPLLTPGTSVVGKSLLVKLTLTTKNASYTPIIDAFSIYVSSAFSSSGTRTSPSLSLTNAGRAANSLVAWNANTPTGTSVTAQTSIDGGSTWQSVTNGGAISGINLAPNPTSDFFVSNTSANYTSTNGTGGGTATITWDTANKRLSLVGGSRAVLLYNGLTVTDVDMLIDVKQAQNSGLTWRYSSSTNYYELVVKDSANGNSFALNKMASGTLSALASGSIVFATGTHHYVRVTMFSGVITAYFDGIQILTYTDASPIASGQAGIRNDTGTSYVYQLLIQPQGDNVSSKSLLTKLTLSSTDPTVTPQVLDLQAFVSNASFGIGVLIPQANYADAYVSANIDDCNKQSNYWWYVSSILDTNSKFPVTFQARTATIAPFPIDSANSVYTTTDGQAVGDMLIANFALSNAADLYRNRQKVKNAIATGSFAQTFTGDGQATTWNVANPIALPPTITLNGQSVSVGIQGGSGSAYYYQLNSTSIIQDSGGAKLQSTDTLIVTYTGSYYQDVLVNNAHSADFPGTLCQDDVAALDGSSGIVTNVVDVKSQNMSVSAATTLANQLLTRYGVIGITITFTTLRYGLLAGQQLTIYCPQININDAQMLITDVETTEVTSAIAVAGVLYQYAVTATTTANLGSWVKLLTAALNG